MDLPKTRKPKDCQFVPLYDLNIMNNIKTPPGLNSLLLWYKKESSDFWGLTAKSFDDAQDLFSKQHVWKVTWTNNDALAVLRPTLNCATLADPIDGELYKTLQRMVQTARERNSKKGN